MDKAEEIENIMYAAEWAAVVRARAVALDRRQILLTIDGPKGVYTLNPVTCFGMGHHDDVRYLVAGVLHSVPVSSIREFGLVTAWGVNYAV